mgnify:CR=1 FL=1
MLLFEQKFVPKFTPQSECLNKENVMHLSLSTDVDQPEIDMHLTALIGQDTHGNPKYDSFGCSIEFFMDILERLKKLPKGHPMSDFMAVGVELSRGIVWLLSDHNLARRSAGDL